MPRYEIQGPDGARYEVEAPDTPAAAAPASPAAPAAQQQNLPDPNSAWGLVKALGSGLVKGVASLPNLIMEGAANMPDVGGAFKNSPEVQAKIDKTNSPKQDLENVLHSPQGTAEKYVDSAGQGIGGMAIGPGSVATKVITGTLSGLGGEVGERVAGAPGRLIGAIAGGAAPSAAKAALGGNTADLARRALSDVSDAELAAALQKMNVAIKAGSPITLGQALGRRTNVDSLENALANSELGPRIQNILNSQPNQLADIAKQVTGKLPGQVVQPNTAANSMQDAATEVINKAKQLRTQAVTKLYEQGGTLPEDVVKGMQAQVQTLASKYPNTTLGDALNNLASRLQIPNPVKQPAAGPTTFATGVQETVPKNVPITDLTQLNEVLKQVYRDVKAPGLNKASVDAFQDKKLRDVLDSLRGQMGELFPAFKAGNDLYKTMSENLVDPLKKSVIGQLAGKTGSQEDVNAARTLADSIFKQGTTPGGTSNILTAERNMRQAGQQAAFLDAAKSYLARTMGELTNVGPNGTPDKFASNVSALFGNEVKRQGLRDTLVGMARAQGMRDTDLLPGFENFLQIAAQQAKRPATIRGMNPAEIATEAGNNVPSNLMRVFGFLPFEKVARAGEARYQASALTALDKMLTSPEGIAQLKELARIPPNSEKARSLVQGLLGGVSVGTNADTSQQ